MTTLPRESAEIMATSMTFSRYAPTSAERDDRYGSPPVTCRTGDGPLTLNQRMVRAGWAWAAYGDACWRDQKVAMAEHIGVWRVPCQVPADWRKARRLVDPASLPDDINAACNIFSAMRKSLHEACYRRACPWLLPAVHFDMCPKEHEADDRCLDR